MIGWIITLIILGPCLAWAWTYFTLKKYWSAIPEDSTNPAALFSLMVLGGLIYVIGWLVLLSRHIHVTITFS